MPSNRSGSQQASNGGDLKSRFENSELAAGMPPEPAGKDARATT
jgi:hypothetical protein